MPESKSAGLRPASGNDPRLGMAAEELEAASIGAMPQVARANGAGDSLGLAVGIIGALGLGLMTWFGLSSERPPAQLPPAQPIVQAAPQTSVLPPIDPSLNPPTEYFQVPATSVAQPLVQPMPAAQSTDPTAGQAPAMVIDNSGPLTPATTAVAPAADGQAGAKSAPSANDAFLASQSTGVSEKAWRIGNPSRVVPQGAVIAAVLETAINSDLPGYTRAIVSRDIRSFDGTNILIPRGSRLIGQYKSGLTSGETRAFIIWDRLIRPDGLSVQLASPATDDLGQAGMAGRVDSHFVKRFGSAALLTIVNGLSSLAGRSGNSTIVIGSSGEASGVIGEALSNDIKIPPTIKVPQGAPIQVFAARDLNFNIGE